MFVGLWTAIRTGEMGWVDEMESSVSNSCEASDPSTPMIGCQFQLLVTEAELVPCMGKLLNECIVFSVDPYSGGMALLEPLNADIYRTCPDQHCGHS